MLKLIKHFAKDSSGVTALEYGIMAGLVSAVIIGAVTTLGTDLNGVFGAVDNALKGVPGV